MKEKVTKYLNRVQKARNSGGGYFIQSDPKLITDTTNDGMGRSWQFRIAIDPDPANIQKASEVLAKVFYAKGRDLEFKIQMPSTNQSSGNNWDGTDTSLNSDSDRDQRGKEVCVYMRYDQSKGKYELSPEEWKSIMLEAWAGLEKAGVKIGYLGTPYGDRVVGTEGDIQSPFSYTAFKPYTGRHGILFQSDYNPQHYPDPLEGVVLTKKDLKRHGIDQSKYSKQQTLKLQEQKEHAQKAEKQIAEKISSITEYSEIEKSYDDFVKLIQEGNTEQISKSISDGSANRLLDQLVEKYPRTNQSSLRMAGELEAIGGYLRRIQPDQNNQETIDQLKKVVDQFHKNHNDNFNKNIEEIINDYKQNPAAMNFLDRHGLGGQLEQLVKANPAGMQLYYRQIVHLHREKINIAQAERRLNVNSSVEEKKQEGQKSSEDTRIRKILAEKVPMAVLKQMAELRDVDPEQLKIATDHLYKVLRDANINASMLTEGFSKNPSVLIPILCSYLVYRSDTTVDLDAMIINISDKTMGAAYALRDALRSLNRSTDNSQKLELPSIFTQEFLIKIMQRDMLSAMELIKCYPEAMNVLWYGDGSQEAKERGDALYHKLNETLYSNQRFGRFQYQYENIWDEGEKTQYMRPRLEIKEVREFFEDIMTQYKPQPNNQVVKLEYVEVAKINHLIDIAYSHINETNLERENIRKNLNNAKISKKSSDSGVGVKKATASIASKAAKKTKAAESKTKLAALMEQALENNDQETYDHLANELNGFINRQKSIQEKIKTYKSFLNDPKYQYDSEAKALLERLIKVEEQVLLADYTNAREEVVKWAYNQSDRSPYVQAKLSIDLQQISNEKKTEYKMALALKALENQGNYSSEELQHLQQDLKVYQQILQERIERLEKSLSFEKIYDTEKGNLIEDWEDKLKSGVKEGQRYTDEYALFQSLVQQHQKFSEQIRLMQKPSLDQKEVTAGTAAVQATQPKPKDAPAPKAPNKTTPSKDWREVSAKQEQQRNHGVRLEVQTALNSGENRPSHSGIGTAPSAVPVLPSIKDNQADDRHKPTEGSAVYRQWESARPRQTRDINHKPLGLNKTSASDHSRPVEREKLLSTSGIFEQEALKASCESLGLSLTENKPEKGGVVVNARQQAIYSVAETEMKSVVSSPNPAEFLRIAQAAYGNKLLLFTADETIQAQFKKVIADAKDNDPLKKIECQFVTNQKEYEDIKRKVTGKENIEPSEQKRESDEENRQYNSPNRP